MNRVILIVLDSVGIGALPDAHLYGDEGCNTLGHIAEYYPDLHLPNLTAMGLGNIDMTNRLEKTAHPTASFGKAMERSSGKDTTTGHWEISGVVLEKPFPVFENGFPAAFISRFEKAIGTQTIGNVAASGTEIINQLGDEHLKTRFPIVYTSADSVFQIAMHEAVFPIEKQYEICRIAREILTGDLEVGRVIARPFEGTSGHFVRTSRRKDFAVSPPKTVLDAIIEHQKGVLGIGKIVDIFNGKGISRYVKTVDNVVGIQATIEAIKKPAEALVFTNLVDFDMLYGHRRDVEGYARALMEFDRYLPEIVDNLTKDDLLIITADHGNDPTAPGTDHTREYIPILNFGHQVTPGINIGIRSSFADIAATIAEALKIPYVSAGKSYCSTITQIPKSPINQIPNHHSPIHMTQSLAASELVLNPDGSVYHCNLLPENLADTVFLVGDPGRVPTVSAFFDRVDFKTQKREIVTHTGTKNGKRVTVISTGMGTDNIDIVLSELDAVANIDLRAKQLKPDFKQLTFIRLGTSGSLQEEIPVDTFMASSHGLGFDGLVHYYAHSEEFTYNPFIEKFIEDVQWDPRMPRPYLVEADTALLEKAVNLGFYSGVTATATGFYGPQGRVLRLNVQDKKLNDKLSAFRFGDLRIANFEMETSGIYGLSKLFGHRAITINCIIANRFTGAYSKDYQKAMHLLIGQVMEAFV